MNKKLSNIELGRLTVEEFKTTKKLGVSVVLDNIRSLNNIGSIFRTADAFLIEKIYLCGITATPPHREIQKTALGATESVAWEYHPDALSLVASLKKDNYFIAAVEQTAKSIYLNDFKIDKTQKTVFIFGNEVEGVSQELVNISDISLEIPQLGTKHSLNISVSTGIVLWDVFKQLATIPSK